MRDFETYKNEYEKAQKFYEHQIADRESKAFEYGVLVVKNAILIAGGGLLAIPAIMGLSADMAVDNSMATAAGFSFAFALIIAIFGTYLIHLNWTLHALSWNKCWDDHQEFLRKAYLEDVPEDELSFESGDHFLRSITATFWAPHVISILYLILIGFGFWKLYGALGVTP